MKISKEVQRKLSDGLMDFYYNPSLLNKIDIWDTIVYYICKEYFYNINISDFDQFLEEFILCLRRNSHIKKLLNFNLEKGSLTSLALYLSHRLRGSMIGRDKYGEVYVFGPYETIQIEKQIKKLSNDMLIKNDYFSTPTHTNLEQQVRELADRFPKL